MEKQGMIANCVRPFGRQTKKGNMETQQNPNEPGKHSAPGQQGGTEQDRETQERERQRREQEKGGGGHQQGGGQPGSR